MKRTNFYINLVELKIRALYLLFGFIFCLLICFLYKTELVYIISSPLLRFEKGFIYTGLLDPLYIYIKICCFAAIILNFLLFVYLLNYFLSKGYSTFLSNIVYIYISCFYFLSLFIFFLTTIYLLPLFFNFIIEYQQVSDKNILEIRLQATIAQYYNLFMHYFWAHIYFSFLPNILMLRKFFFKADKNNTSILRKYTYLFAFLFFLLIAPPDLVTQLTLLPFILISLELQLFFGLFFFNFVTEFKIFEESRDRTYDE